MTTAERRHCGRCQMEFEADPELYFQTDWALCPSCEAILLPPRPGSRPPVVPEEASAWS